MPLGISQEEPRKTATTTLQISIKDLNDNAPIFELSTYNASVRESLPIGKWIKNSVGSNPNTVRPRLTRFLGPKNLKNRVIPKTALIEVSNM